MDLEDLGRKVVALETEVRSVAKWADKHEADCASHRLQEAATSEKVANAIADLRERMAYYVGGGVAVLALINLMIAWWK